MSEIREEFVSFAQVEGSNVSLLCRQFGISRTCAYKWLCRSSLEDLSRRPLHSPRKTSGELEARIVALRTEHPSWGGRKLRRLLENEGVEAPSASTITQVLRRHSLLTGPGAGEPRDWVRFERELPNELWQMDFKGHFPMLVGRCHPLTVVDDCSRFSPLLLACGSETGQVVKAGLTQAFRNYGMPLAMLCDNGGPWGQSGEITVLGAWIMRLGIRLYHGRPYHPQTQGKEERFHRTLNTELLATRSFGDLSDCQRGFDVWRSCYNLKRPHDSLGLDTPGSRYLPSPREFPELLPTLKYAPGDLVRKVQQGGKVSFLNREFRVGKGLVGLPIGIRSTKDDGVYEVRFAHQIVTHLDLRHNLEAKDVSTMSPNTC